MCCQKILFLVRNPLILQNVDFSERIFFLIGGHEGFLEDVEYPMKKKYQHLVTLIN